MERVGNRDTFGVRDADVHGAFAVTFACEAPIRRAKVVTVQVVEMVVEVAAGRAHVVVRLTVNDVANNSSI